MTPQLAHAGHWLVQILYAAPLIVMVALLVIGKLRGRREEQDRHEKERP